MAQLPVAPHLTHAEIDRRYRTCPHPAEKTRWHLLWLVSRPANPLSATAAARLVGFTPTWGRTLLKRYNAGGPDALADGRRGNGAAPKLTPERQAELLAALRQPPSDGGLWSGPKVVAFVRDRWGVEVVPQTGWQWLRDLGFRLVVPRPRHPKAATAEQQRRWL
jgi:transposase